MCHPKRKLVFQPSIFSGYVSFREGIICGVFLPPGDDQNSSKLSPLIFVNHARKFTTAIGKLGLRGSHGLHLVALQNQGQILDQTQTVPQNTSKIPSVVVVVVFGPFFWLLHILFGLFVEKLENFPFPFCLPLFSFFLDFFRVLPHCFIRLWMEFLA